MMHFELYVNESTANKLKIKVNYFIISFIYMEIYVCIYINNSFLYEALSVTINNFY